MAIENIGLYPITIDVDGKYAETTVYANDNDTNSRGLLITLMKDGVPFDSTGINLRIGFLNSEGKPRLYDCETVDALTGKYRVFYPTEMLLGNGGRTVKLEIKAYDGNGALLNYAPLFVYINASEIHDDALEGTNEASTLLNALGKVENINESFNAINDDLILKADKTYVDNKNDEVNAQLAEMTTESLVVGAIPLTALRMVFQYNNQFDISKIKRLKQMGFNTVIVPNSNTWQTDTAQMLAFLDLHLKYGVYTIIELNTSKLMSDSYSEEQAWITSLENHPGLIGFYSFDEPVYNSISKANQELVYNRIKQVTVKNVFMSDVAFLTVRLPMFQEYYTEKAFDIYMVNNYLNHEEPGWIKTHILESMVNLKNTPGIIPPKVVIPSLPFFTEIDNYDYPPTELKIKAHIDAWRPFLNGSYAVFAHDNPLLTTTLDTSELYRKIVSSIPSYISNNITDNKMYVNGGIDIYEGGIDLYDKGINVKNKPSYFEKGINIGGGTQLIQKYLFSVGDLDFGVINANSTKTLTMNAFGANPIDGVICNPYVTLMPDGIIWNAHISSTNVVSIRLTNVTPNPIAVGIGTWAVDVIVR